ncbi:MAG: YjjG family noncanonical pyrimidine nucleotidase [Anaerolineae bacterium]
MQYKWILFDADGTLFDYDRAESTALEKTFQQMGHRFESRYTEAYRRINGQIWLDFEQGKISQDRLRVKRFELLFEAVNVESDPLEFSERYLKNLADGSDLIEGAEDTISALYGKVGLVVITNGLKDVQRPRLAKSAIGDYLAEVVISEEVGAAKPDRRIFDVAFSRMGNPKKDEVLIVGDSLTSDIKGGNEYGIDTCWFNPTQTPCYHDVEIQYEISSLSELLTIVSAA